MTHAAYVSHGVAAIAYWQYKPSDRVLRFASFSFDVSIDQLLTPLLAGATVVMRGAEIWDPAVFTDIIRKHRLTVVHLPPIYWQEWVALQFWMSRNRPEPPVLTAPPALDTQAPQVAGFGDATRIS